jgi:hypothetical protein
VVAIPLVGAEGAASAGLKGPGVLGGAVEYQLVQVRRKDWFPAGKVTSRDEAVIFSESLHVAGILKHYWGAAPQVAEVTAEGDETCLEETHAEQVKRLKAEMAAMRSLGKLPPIVPGKWDAVCRTDGRPLGGEAKASARRKGESGEQLRHGLFGKLRSRREAEHEKDTVCFRGTKYRLQAQAKDRLWRYGAQRDFETHEGRSRAISGRVSAFGLCGSYVAAHESGHTQCCVKAQRSREAVQERRLRRAALRRGHWWKGEGLRGGQEEQAKVQATPQADCCRLSGRREGKAWSYLVSSGLASERFQPEDSIADWNDGWSAAMPLRKSRRAAVWDGGKNLLDDGTLGATEQGNPSSSAGWGEIGRQARCSSLPKTPWQSRVSAGPRKNWSASTLIARL